MNKWFKNKQQQKKLKKFNTIILNICDAFFKLTLATEDSIQSINKFSKTYEQYPR